MEAILINISQDIQTDKSRAIKLLNLTTHFSEMKNKLADAKGGKKVMWHIASFYDRWFQMD